MSPKIPLVGLETVDASPHPASDYANRQTDALHNPVQFDADLQLVIKAWDNLPQVVRSDIVGLVNAVPPNR
jgi:hypothetical protein